MLSTTGFYIIKSIVDQIDAERDAMHDKNNMSTSRKGSHIYKEGSTGESEFSNFPGFNKSSGELGQNF